MTSGHNSLSNLNHFRLAFPLSTVTRKLPSYVFARLSTGTGRGFLVASFHTALVPSLTLPLSPVGRQGSHEILIYRIFAPTKSPEQGLGRKESGFLFAGGALTHSP